MTVRVDLSQAPARVIVTATVGDVRDGGVPPFLLEFGGDGTADVLIEPEAALEVATRFRAAVMMLLLQADCLSYQARRGRSGERTSAGRVEPVPELPGAV